MSVVLSVDEDLIDLHLGYGVIRNALDQGVVCAAMEDIQRFFFREGSYKERFVRQDVAELGYRCLPFRESFMLRSSEVPKELEGCLRYLEVVHALARESLTLVAQRLEVNPQRFLDLVRPSPFADGSLNPSTLRLLHYKGSLPSPTKPRSSVACDVHQDVGLLTLVMRSNAPALEVYDFCGAGEWVDVEGRLHGQDLAVMNGETLSLLTNRVCLTGTHRVRQTTGSRFSVVYQLRVEPDAVMDSRDFASRVVGQFQEPFCLTGAEFYGREIRRRSSVNGSY